MLPTNMADTKVFDMGAVQARWLDLCRSWKYILSSPTTMTPMTMK